MIGSNFSHRAIDHLRAPRCLFEIDSLGEMTGTETGQARRQNEKNQEARNDVADK